MPATVIVGTQWGDEGKGKIVDYLAAEADVVVRFQGGANAGHTVLVGSELYKFRLLPSGIVRPKTLNLIGNGVVVDPEELLQEIEDLRKRGFACDNLRISDRAHVVMPWHKVQDGLEEERKGALAAGTTRRGIGPAYADKHGRFGLRIIDLLEPEVLKAKLGLLAPLKEKVVSAFGGKASFDVAALHKEYTRYGERLKDYVVDGSAFLDAQLAAGKSVLLEGAQGTHLCVDHGIYPFGTSSNCVAGAATVGAGIGPTRITEVLGVAKAYTSRVGAGPFPAEQKNEVGDHLQREGAEFGTVTGRPRRCGWLDLVMVRASARVNGLTGLLLTKLDVLGGLKEVKVAESYRHRGKTLKEFPASMKVLAEVEPVYRTYEGWDRPSPEVRKSVARKGVGGLPAAARAYVQAVEKALGVPIVLIGYGKERSEIIDLRRKAPAKRGKRR